MKACVDCHFLTKTLERRRLLVRSQERESMRKGDYSSFERHSLSCYFGVWDEGLRFEEERRHELITKTNREDYCFFWKYRPGMLLPAAERLQKREADRREAARDRKLTLWGLWIAAIALILDFLADVGLLSQLGDLLRCLLPW